MQRKILTSLAAALTLCCFASLAIGMEDDSMWKTVQTPWGALIYTGNPRHLNTSVAYGGGWLGDLCADGQDAEDRFVEKIGLLIARARELTGLPAPDKPLTVIVYPSERGLAAAWGESPVPKGFYRHKERTISLCLPTLDRKVLIHEITHYLYSSALFGQAVGRTGEIVAMYVARHVDE